MPYVSRAQQRLFHAKEERGEISKAVVDEFDKATDFKNLPERVADRKKIMPRRRKDAESS